MEALSKEPSKIALALVDVFFSRETAKSLVTQKDKERLDHDIEGIRCKQLFVIINIIMGKFRERKKIWPFSLHNSTSTHESILIFHEILLFLSDTMSCL